MPIHITMSDCQGPISSRSRSSVSPVISITCNRSSLHRAVSQKTRMCCNSASDGDRKHDLRRFQEQFHTCCVPVHQGRNSTRHRWHFNKILLRIKRSFGTLLWKNLATMHYENMVDPLFCTCYSGFKTPTSFLTTDVDPPAQHLWLPSTLPSHGNS